MPTLKEEILKAIAGCCISDKSAEHVMEICKRHIEEAFEAGHDRGVYVGEGFDTDEEPLSKSEYLKSKGITE